MKIILAVFCVLCTPMLLAHGSVTEKIRQLDEKIVADPDNLQWRFQRGVQWLLNTQADHALDDLEFVLDRDAIYPQLQLYLGRAYVLAGHFAEAEEAFSTALLSAYGNADAEKDVLIQRGSLRQQRKQYAGAAEDWLRVIQLSTEPQSDWLLFAARNVYASGLQQKAIAILEQGLVQLGPVQLFHEQIIEWLLNQQQFDAAYARFDQLIQQSERPDLWHVRKADVLSQQKNKIAARQHYDAAWQLVQQLPAHIRQRAASVEYEQQLQKKLAAVSH